MSEMQELPEGVTDLVVLAEKDGYLMVFTRLPESETLEILERTIAILETDGLGEKQLTRH
jgi:hypothetical protein